VDSAPRMLRARAGTRQRNRGQQRGETPAEPRYECPRTLTYVRTRVDALNVAKRLERRRQAQNCNVHARYNLAGECLMSATVQMFIYPPRHCRSVLVAATAMSELLQKSSVVLMAC